MNNSFQNQLSSIAKSQEEVLANKLTQKQQDAIKSANYEYNRLKEQLLMYAKNNGYSTDNEKKIISYQYDPVSSHAAYIQDNGIELVKTLFGGQKLKSTNRNSVKPHPTAEWTTYFNELCRLARQDNITITPVVYNTISKKVICRYPAYGVYDSNANFTCIDVFFICRVEFK